MICVNGHNNEESARTCWQCGADQFQLANDLTFGQSRWFKPVHSYDDFLPFAGILLVVSVFMGWNQFSPTNNVPIPGHWTVWYDSSPIGLGFGAGHLVWLVVALSGVVLGGIYFIEKAIGGLNAWVFVVVVGAVILTDVAIGGYMLNVMGKWAGLATSFTAPSGRHLHVSSDGSVGWGAGVFGIALLLAFVPFVTALRVVGRRPQFQ